MVKPFLLATTITTLCLGDIFASDSPIEYPAFPEVLKGDWSVLPYVQMEFLAPGLGICMRSSRIEINFKTSSAIWWNTVAGSVSALYGRSTGDGTLYCAIGGGLVGNDMLDGRYGMIGLEFSPLVTTFFGYETKNGFSDIGVDIFRSTYIPFSFENSHLSVLPTLRYGWKF